MKLLKINANRGMDFAGTTVRVMAVKYNEWGAMKQDYLGNNRAVVNGSAGT